MAAPVPRVAAVIPARDAESTIGRAISSVQAQTRKVDEIVVVDDHSTDRTHAVVAEVASRDARIRLVEAQARGSGHARNRGVRHATCELVAFLDADDVWYPDKIETQLPYLTDDVVVVGGLLHYLGQDGTVLGTYVPFDDWDEATESLRRAETMPVSLASGLLRRQDLLDAGGFDETFMRTQDLELAQRLVATGRRVVWPPGRVLGGYVLHGGGVSATTYREQFLAAELVRARLRGTTTAGYEEWMRDPVLSRAAARALRSGQHYRMAAVAKGAGARAQLLRHGFYAVATDPVGVLRKLRLRSRRTAELVPAAPPRQVRAEFRRPTGPVPSRLSQFRTVDVSGLRLVEDPWTVGAAAITDLLDDPRPLVLAAAHVTSLNLVDRPDFVAAFNTADAGYADGISWPIVAAAAGERVVKVATSDLAPAVLSWMAGSLGRPVRVAVLGGAPGGGDRSSLAERAGRTLEVDLPVQLVHATHGYHEDWSPVLADLRDVHPDVVLVGLGMPMEAFWTRAHRLLLPPAIVMTCGGWLRILAGEEKRASVVLQRLHLEWLHRLTNDPRRTVRRYALGSVNLLRESARAAPRRGGPRGA
ncbi:WecB/TagA/CpsF family glycosyltransferase [Ornithinimicrobium sp. W1665]|uniref:WecB/TagA/CpsF family glycosyltransferase n=1 Tax=Ornithinimicrobium sp. W1665 TaxID=3416666 RepID=UPI003CFAD84A